MKRWTLAGIGLATFVLALLAAAPATLVDAALRRAGDGRIRLAEAQGSLWSGRGHIEIRDSGGKAGVSRPLSWRFRPASLLRGNLVCEFRLEPAGVPVPVTLSWSRIRLENADLDLPATALGLAVPKLVPLGLSGDILIHIAGLSIEQGKADGTATLQWRTAGSSLTQVSPLGNYELKLDAAGKTVHAYLRTIEGPLRLDGNGAWTQGSNPTFLATAQVPAEHRLALGPLLRLIAVDQGEGRFELLLN